MKRTPDTDFCGECCRPIDVETRTHRHNGTAMCKSRTATMAEGREIVTVFDALTATLIANSDRDPRDLNNWLLHPAADGNKGYRTWRVS